MDCIILKNGDMKFTVDAEEHELLRTEFEDNCDRFRSDAFMHEWFEGFIGNSEYAWVRPEECGALTSAPILGIYGKERALKEGEDCDYLSLVGSWGGETWVQDVVDCWAFMDYQVISVQEQLLDTGEAVFTHG